MELIKDIAFRSFMMIAFAGMVVACGYTDDAHLCDRYSGTKTEQLCWEVSRQPAWELKDGSMSVPNGKDILSYLEKDGKADNPTTMHEHLEAIRGQYETEGPFTKYGRVSVVTD